MKVVQLIRKRYELVKACGKIHSNFLKESLMQQLLPALSELDNRKSRFLVFDEHEEKMIMKLLDQVMGGVKQGKKNGNCEPGSLSLLRSILEPNGYYDTAIPTDFDATHVTLETKDWSLAICKCHH